MKNMTGHSQDLSAVLGEALSHGDNHHIKHNTMSFKCLLRNMEEGKRILSLGTIRLQPSQMKRSVPLASGHLLLEAVSCQALGFIVGKGVVSFLGSKCKAVLPQSLRLVEELLAGIPESEDIAGLGGRLVSPPELQCQVMGLERLEGNSPWLSMVTFMTQTRLPRYVRVGDTSCVLRVSPKPVDPGVRGMGIYPINASLLTPVLGAPVVTIQEPVTVAKKCANCGGQHSASYRGCEAFSHFKHVATVQASRCISWVEAEQLIRTKDRPSTLNNHPLVSTNPQSVTPRGPGSVSPGPDKGATINGTPSPVMRDDLPGSGESPSPKSGAGDFRSSTPHDGEATVPR